MAGASSDKHAVIVSGGGANGAFEVGALEALFTGASPATNREPLGAEIFTGTSVGSYNATFFVARPGTDPATVAGELKDVWLDEVAHAPGECGNGVFRFRGNLADALTPACFVRHPMEHLEWLNRDGSFLLHDWWRRGRAFLRSSEDLPRRTLELFDLSSYVSTEPWKQLLRKTIPLDGLARSNQVLKLVATNWETGLARFFDREELANGLGHTAILASSAIPGFFPPVEIEGVSYADGGLVMNTPLKPAIRAGADVIHMIYLDPDLKNIPLHELKNTIDTLDRMMTLQFANHVNADIAAAMRINRGLDVIRKTRSDEDLTSADGRAFIETAGRIRKRLKEDRPYRRLTVHRYHPREDLSGVMGLLNFGRDRIAKLIKRGYESAEQHDCNACGCIL